MKLTRKPYSNVINVTNGIESEGAYSVIKNMNVAAIRHSIVRTVHTQRNIVMT